MTTIPVEVFSDPTTVSREDELRAFIGPDADKFIRTWQGEQAAIEAKRTGVKATVKRHRGFVVMAFFLGPCWFFYRKLWLWAWGYVGVIVLLAVLPIPSRVSFPVGIILALWGRTLYIQHAAKRIEKLRNGAISADLELLRREGGVSKLACWISIVVFVALIVLAIIGVALADRVGR